MFSPIPIVSLGNALSFLVGAVIAIRLYSTWKESRSGEIKNFFLTFVFLAGFFFFAAVPGLLSTNPTLLGLANFATLPLAHFGAYFFAVIPLTLFQLRRLKMAYTLLFAGVLGVSLVFRVLGFGPLEEMRQGNLVFWLRPENPFMEFSFILSGVLLLISVGLAGFVFMLHALRNRSDRFLFFRSLLLGTGAALLGVVAVLNYIIGSTPTAGSQLASSIM
ncbi:MAG: hypothetical protein U1C72_02360, partial [Candidatus Pacearchaeota archaeon]|nr:hypothetical protein [Candidatus Pacearchaeota archaeon]